MFQPTAPCCMFDNAQSARIAGVDFELVPALAALVPVHVFQEQHFAHDAVV